MNKLNDIEMAREEDKKRMQDLEEKMRKMEEMFLNKINKIE